MLCEFIHISQVSFDLFCVISIYDTDTKYIVTHLKIEHRVIQMFSELLNNNSHDSKCSVGHLIRVYPNNHVEIPR